MILKCLLIKDRPAVTELLTNFIEKTATLTLLATANDTNAAAQVMNQTLPDIVLLTRLQFLQLKNNGFTREEPPVFICICDDNSVGKDNTALLCVNNKKLSYENFLDVINKAVVQILGSVSVNNHKEEQFLFIKSEYRIVKINYNDILFCEGLKDYTQIYTSRKAKPIITLQNLKTFSDRLPSRNFVRIHRSYIVSLNHIETISKKEVEIGEKIIPIGNSYRNNLLDIIRLNS